MFGPRIVGKNDVSLRPPVLDDYVSWARWMMEPEVTRFWAPRFGEITTANAEERMKKDGDSRIGVVWTIAYREDNVGHTGVFGIDWVRRDGVSGIFIGRHDLYGRGIASEAVRLRMAFAWRELGLRRVHNWIAVANRGSRRANEKAGYRQMGIFPRAWFRSGEWFDMWLGEASPETFPADALPSAWQDQERPG